LRAFESEEAVVWYVLIAKTREHWRITQSAKALSALRS
jgi:hypothetical protein